MRNNGWIKQCVQFLGHKTKTNGIGNVVRNILLAVVTVCMIVLSIHGIRAYTDAWIYEPVLSLHAYAWNFVVDESRLQSRYPDLMESSLNTHDSILGSFHRRQQQQQQRQLTVVVPILDAWTRLHTTPFARSIFQSSAFCGRRSGTTGEAELGENVWEKSKNNKNNKKRQASDSQLPYVEVVFVVPNGKPSGTLENDLKYLVTSEDRVEWHDIPGYGDNDYNEDDASPIHSGRTGAYNVASVEKTRNVRLSNAPCVYSIRIVYCKTHQESGNNHNKADSNNNNNNNNNSRSIGVLSFADAVECGLASATLRTRHFLVMSSHFVPLSSPQRHTTSLGGQSFLEGILRPLQLNSDLNDRTSTTNKNSSRSLTTNWDDGSGGRRRGGHRASSSHHRNPAPRIASIQCTIVTSSPDVFVPLRSLLQENNQETETRSWRKALLVADKGADVRVITSSSQDTFNFDFARRLNGYRMTDQRAAWDEVVDATNKHCTLYNRDLYEAAGGFGASPTSYEPTSSFTRAASQDNLERIADSRMKPSRYAFLEKHIFEEASELRRTRHVRSPSEQTVLDTDDSIGWDLSLRQRWLFPHWSIMVSGGATAIALHHTPAAAPFTPTPPSTQVLSNTPNNDHHPYFHFIPSYPISGLYLYRWVLLLKEMQEVRFASSRTISDSMSGGSSTSAAVVASPSTHHRHGLVVEWMGNYARVPCSGVMIEATSYLIQLAQRWPLSVSGDLRYHWCPGIPRGALNTLERTQPWLSSAARLPYHLVTMPSSATRGIVINHVTGLQIQARRNKKYTKGNYVAVRILSEFSNAPQGIVNFLGTQVDELWVTADFFAKTYHRAGVPKDKLVVIPEAVDVYQYDPANYVSLIKPVYRTLKGTWTNRPTDPAVDRKQFVFLSIFKWEPRKGWDVLLKAYWDAFGPHSPHHNNVTLILKVSFLQPFSQGVNASTLGSRLEQWGVEHLDNFTSIDQFPRIIHVGSGLSSEELVRLYKTADAFVLPTRGEGWGLPIIEAMAMGLPVITTDWSGVSGFVTRDTAFAIPLDGVEEIPVDSDYGHVVGKKWALPSAEGLATLMRYVFENRDHARTVGARARRHIVEHYSEEAVADLIDDRLRRIESRLKYQSYRTSSAWRSIV